MEILGSAKAWGRAHLDVICEVAARKGVLPLEKLREYYQCLGFDLGHGEREGLLLFFRLLEEVGEIPSVPDLEIVSPLAWVA